MQPLQNQVVDENVPVTFAIAAEGSGELSYQWFHNGVPVAGANGNTLTLASAQYSDRGYYQARVADSTGMSRSHAAFLNLRVANEIVTWGGLNVIAPSGLNNVLAISLGDAYGSLSPDTYCFVLKSDGTVVGLGGGAPAVPAELSDVVAIAAGGSRRTCFALKSDGTMVGWTEFREVPAYVPAGLSRVVAIATHGDVAMALKDDGTVVTWIIGFAPDNDQFARETDVIAIAAGHETMLVLKSDGTAVPATRFAGAPTDLVAISEGGTSPTFSLALRSNGTVISSLGDVPAGLSDVIAIAAGFSHSLALKANGTVVAWGDNSKGAATVPAGLSGVIAIDADFHTSGVIRRIVKPLITVQPQPASQTLASLSSITYSVTATGNGLSYQWNKDGVPIPSATESTYTNGRLDPNDSGSYTVTVSNALGSVTSNGAALLVKGPAFTKNPEPSQVVNNSAAVTMNAVATSTGAITYQWLHNGLPVAGATGTSMTLAHARYSDRGYYQLKATDASGTTISKAGFINVLVPATLKVWGYNRDGLNTPPAGLSGVVAFSAGENQNLALKSDGTVVAWGSDDAANQVPPGLSNVVAISCKTFNVALKSDGTIVAWGKPYSDQRAAFSGLSDVVAVSEHFVVKSDGTVGSWGFPGEQPPVVGAGFSDVSVISASGTHLLALKTNGTVRDSYSWKGNPVPFWLANVAAVSVCDSFSAAVKTDGTVVTWNYDGYGRSAIPAECSEIAAISSGADHVVALKSNGTVVAWGKPNPNFGGQEAVPATLGDVIAIDAGSYYNLALEIPLPVPAVTTKAATAIYSGSATFNADVIPGGFPATFNGDDIPGGLPANVYFQLRTEAFSYETVTRTQEVGSGNTQVAISASVANLPAGKTLYYRAVVTNGRVIIYGADQAFITLPLPPLVTAVNSGTATLSGLFNPNGLTASAYFEYQTGAGPALQTIAQEFGASNAPVTLMQTLSGLQGGQTYQVRLVSTSTAGTSYSDYQIFFTATNPRPSVRSASVSGVPSLNLLFNASINPNGLAANVYFEYGATNAYGSKTAPQKVTAGYSEVTVSATVNGLLENPVIHYRAVASNLNGISYGEDQTFTGSAAAPALSKPFSSVRISGDRIVVSGTCNPNGAATNLRVESRGSGYTSVRATQEIGSSLVPVPISFTLTNDGYNFPYNVDHYIVVATNALGTDSASLVFKTSVSALAVDDIISGGAKPFRINVLANDTSFNGYRRAISSVTQGTSGTVSIKSDLTIQYSPGSNFTGSDTFTYTIPDGLGGFSTATVKILGDSIVTPGTYVGLALSNSPLHETGSYLRATVTKTGVMSGRLQYAGYSFAVKGSLAFGNTVTMSIQPPGQPLLSVNFSAGEMGGAPIKVVAYHQTGATAPVVEFEAHHSPYSRTSPWDLPARYTATLSLETNSSDPALPKAAGYAAIIINRLGAARVVGKLGDGTPISVEGLVDDTRQLPFYTGLYGRNSGSKGSIFGKINFQTLENVPQCSGLLYWHKPAQAGDRRYSNGFTTKLSLTGGSYTSSAPALTLLKAQPNADLTISGGNLADEMHKELSVASSYRARITNPAADRMAVRFNPVTGFFSGSFRDISQNVTRTFNGVLLQHENIGTGLFLGESETGGVLLKPRP
ncbi:MAG: hypothetical protein JWL59_108 [Chthoniobacteraceae bacterium]|nr:hypothetical protein [Chthoniobacteraceae bacterium]